jgi:hypothetical protein
MTDKLFKRAVKRLLEQEETTQIELAELPFHLALYPKGNELIVEIRKRWKIRLDEPATTQAVYIKKLLAAVFSDKPVVAKIKIECTDSFATKAKLRALKLL